jgi:hypothetical protein
MSEEEHNKVEGAGFYILYIFLSCPTNHSLVELCILGWAIYCFLSVKKEVK